MKKTSINVIGVCLISLGLSGTVYAQPRYRTVSNRESAASPLTGVYRIDIPASDKLYSVVAGASSNLPFGEQQRFFIDLAVRLTPPDLLALEKRGGRVSIGSSRAPRVTLVADGITRTGRANDGHLIRSRLAFDNSKLVFTSSGRTEDNFSVVFTSIDNGKRLRVTRRISAEQLNEPVVIETIYNKISNVARWDLYGEAQVASKQAAASPVASPEPSAPGNERSQAGVLRTALAEWLDATNKRDIEKQMSFYMPELKAFYLTRNTPRAFVRNEKARVFATAGLIDIRAEEPEIIFQGDGRTAIMRYRKKYRVENGAQSRRGEVIQELRWQLTDRGWRIFSERDIRVLR
ncbi:MAG: nuclear transport factor 2 family protein [Pyrinomonadaceae bacterium]